MESTIGDGVFMYSCLTSRNLMRMQSPAWGPLSPHPRGNLGDGSSEAITFAMFEEKCLGAPWGGREDWGGFPSSLPLNQKHTQITQLDDLLGQWLTF